MKLNRLFEIVYILMNKEQVTAKHLADRFEVSTRTIYRDIDVLSQCGIPVYASKGKGGGIKLIEGYKIDKAMLTGDEQSEILSALQGLNAAGVNDGSEALSKLSSFFNADSTDWIEIDFSSFSANSNWRNNFENIKNAIINRRSLIIQYASLKGEMSEREIQPIKLIFKSVSWYLYAYCKSKGDYRMFKLNRIMSLDVTDETFPAHNVKYIPKDVSINIFHDEKLKLKVDKEYAFRIYDDFPSDDITEADDCFIVDTPIYEKEWTLSYILSFGDGMECLEPVSLRTEITEIIKRSMKKYS